MCVKQPAHVHMLKNYKYDFLMKKIDHMDIPAPVPTNNNEKENINLDKDSQRDLDSRKVKCAQV